MSQNEIRERVWEYLRENFLYMRPDLVVNPDDSLLRAGVIDSLGVMEVIEFVESLGRIKVDESEITEANFGTLNAIARFVEQKIESAGSMLPATS